MRKLGLRPGDPTRVREWEGRWCRDDSVLVYPYDPRKNAWDRVLPAGQVRTILGVDFGYTSPSAFTVSSSIRGLPDVWLRCSYGLTQLLPGQIAAEIHRLKQRFQIHEIYGDGGGLGITIIKQLQQDFGIPIVPAEKQDKAGAIARVRQLFTSGLMHVDEVECAELIDEQSVLTWDKDHKGHNPDQHDHRSDSVLYSTRPHDLSEAWEKEPPKPGTKEWDEAWAKQQKAKAVAQMRGRNRR